MANNSNITEELERLNLHVESLSVTVEQLKDTLGNTDNPYNWTFTDALVSIAHTLRELQEQQQRELV